MHARELRRSIVRGRAASASGRLIRIPGDIVAEREKCGQVLKPAEFSRRDHEAEWREIVELRLMVSDQFVREHVERPLAIRRLEREMHK